MKSKLFDSCFQNLLQQKRIRSESRTEELRNEFSRSAMEIAERDPSLTELEILMSASEEVSAKMKHVETKKLEREVLNAEAKNKAANLAASTKDLNPNAVLNATLMTTHGMKLDVDSVEQGHRGFIRSTQNVLGPLYRLLGDKFNVFESGQAVSDFADSIYGAGKNSEMNAAVKNMQNMFENMRQRINSLGGDIAKLESWRAVQKWSPDHAERAWKRHTDAQTPDIFKGLKPFEVDAKKRAMATDVFVKDWMEWIDYDQTRLPDGGIRTPAEMEQFLRASFDSIFFGDIADLKSGVGGATPITKAQNQFSRQLHIKDAQSWKQAHAAWGDGSVFDQMQHGVTSLGMQIKMMERFGPDPVRNIDEMVEESIQAAKARGAGKVETAKIVTDGYLAKKKVRWMLGEVEQAPRATGFLKAVDGFANLQMMKLGSATITSITDNAMMRLTAAVNKSWGATDFVGGLARLNPKNIDDRVMLENAGLMSETLSYNLVTGNKGIVDTGWTKFAANQTIRLSALAHITNARRSTFAVGMSNALGAKLKRFNTLAEIDGIDGDIIRSRGITEEDWQELKKASIGFKTTAGKEYPNLLDAESIQNQQLKEKVLGFFAEETNMAVLEPGMRERFYMSAGQTKGSAAQVIFRSLLMFKGFPIAMMSKHFERAGSLGIAGGIGYSAASMTGAAVFGGIAIQANEIINGKDPRDMTDPKFMLASLLKGGSLGIYGDVIFSTERDLTSTIAGPAIGDAMKVASIAASPFVAAKQGKEFNETRQGGQLIQVGRSYIPGNTLWWSKGIVDRLLVAQMQEAINPGYIDRQARRQRSEYGNEYWWGRDEFTPERAPNLEKALGE